MKYFKEGVGHPNLKGATEILPLGIEYGYVSSTFVNGFLNLFKPMVAVVLNRYYDEEEEREPLEINGLTIHSKQEAIEALDSDHDFFHTKLDMFFDDIIMLSKGEDGVYMYFWLDRDCSDCCIGRFQTDDPEEKVRQEFFKKLKELEYSNTEIPVTFMKGWISW